MALILDVFHGGLILAEFVWMEWRTEEDTFWIHFGDGLWQDDIFLLFDAYGILRVMERVIEYWETFPNEITMNERIAMRRYCYERLDGRIYVIPRERG